MFKVTTGKTRATPLMVTVKVNNKDLQMEVDTSVSAFVISEEIYGRLAMEARGCPTTASNCGDSPHIYRREAGQIDICINIQKFP